MSQGPNSGGEELELLPPKRTLLRRITAWLERARVLRGWVEALRARVEPLCVIGQGRSRSLGIFGAVVLGQLTLVAGVGAVFHQSAIGGIIALAAFAFALAGLWLVVSMQVPHRCAHWIQLIPGSLFYAVGVVCVILFNIVILDQLLKEKSTTYGALGIAAALLLGFFPIGRVMVGAAVTNATLYERHARSARQDALPGRSQTDE